MLCSLFSCEYQLDQSIQFVTKSVSHSVSNSLWYQFAHYLKQIRTCGPKETNIFVQFVRSYRENCGAISVIPVYRSLTLIIRTISRTSDYRKQITDQDHNSDSLRQAKSFPTVRFPSKMMACHGTKNDYLENIHFLDWWIGWVQLVRGQNVVLLKQIDHLSHHNTGG